MTFPPNERTTKEGGHLIQMILRDRGVSTSLLALLVVAIDTSGGRSTESYAPVRPRGESVPAVTPPW